MDEKGLKEEYTGYAMLSFVVTWNRTLLSVSLFSVSCLFKSTTLIQVDDEKVMMLFLEKQS